MCQFVLWELMSFNLPESCLSTPAPVSGRSWQPLSSPRREKYGRVWWTRSPLIWICSPLSSSCHWTGPMIWRGMSILFHTESLLHSANESTGIRSLVSHVWVYSSWELCIQAFSTAYFWTKGRMNFQLTNTNKIMACSSFLLHVCIILSSVSVKVEMSWWAVVNVNDSRYTCSLVQ